VPSRPLQATMMVVALLVASACGASPATETTSDPAPTGPVDLTRAEDAPPRAGGRLAVGLTAETNSFDPHKGQWGLSGFAVANAVLDPLAVTDRTGHAAPYLAERFTPNGDFTSWVIELRPGVRFHDGSPLDAAVVVANLEATKASPLLGKTFDLVSSVTASGPSTVTVHLSGPWSTFPAHLAGQAGYIVARATMNDPEGGTHPIGTGPFTFKSWARDDKLVVDRNRDYWRLGRPYLDQVEFRVVTDPHSRLQSIQSGSLDAGVWSSPYKDVQEAATSRQLQMFTDAGSETAEIFLTLNTASAPFDDPVARQALDAVVDRAALNETAFDNLFVPADGPISPDSPMARGGGSEPPPPDLAKAERLAEDYRARHGTPLSFTVLCTPVTEYQAALQALQVQAKAAGIDMKIDTQVQSALIAAVLTGKYQASGFFFFGNQHFDLEYPYLAAQPSPPGQLSLNFSRIDDPEMRAAMDDARTTDDPERQAEDYRKVEERLQQNHAIVFLAHARTAFAYADNVRGPNRQLLPDGNPAATSTAPFFTETWKVS